jgi:hypothetical protein
MAELRQQSQPVRPQGHGVTLSGAFHAPASQAQVLFPLSVTRIPGTEIIDVLLIRERAKNAIAGLYEFSV